MAETDRLGLARRLRDVRRRAGLSQQDVAGLLGVARSVVSDIERGRRRVDALELASFSRATGADVDLLLGAPAAPVEGWLWTLPGWRDLDDADRRSVELHAAFLVWRHQQHQQPDLGCLAPCGPRMPGRATELRRVPLANAVSAVRPPPAVAGRHRSVRLRRAAGRQRGRWREISFIARSLLWVCRSSRARSESPDRHSPGCFQSGRSGFAVARESSTAGTQGSDRRARVQK